MLRRRVVPLLVLAALAPAPAAQLTEAQAVKQFKSALAQELPEIKADMNEAKLVCFDAIAAFEAVLKDGTYTTGDATTLFDALQTLQGFVGAITRAAGNSISLAAGDALEGLANGGDLAGIYPKGFDPGDGGLIDVFRANVHKLQDKLIAAVQKRLAKTRKLAEKQLGLGLTVSLARPGAVRDLTFSETGGFFISEESPITVDLLLGVSELDALVDGVVYLGGTANPNLGVVDLLLTGPHEYTGSGGVPTSVQERWGATFDDFGAGVLEGVYIARATQGTDGPIATGSIGVR